MSECVIWRGSVSNGYGTMWLEGRNQRAHRVFYTVYRGAIPRGQVLHHTCETRLCVNPWHLVPMTLGDHLLLHDLPAKGQPAMIAIQRAKTHCPQGHPYSGDNVRIKSGGGRGCMTCHRADAKRRAARRRAA